jgi:hypothetical protein
LITLPLGQAFNKISGAAKLQVVRPHHAQEQQVAALTGLSENVLAHTRRDPGHSITGF